MALLLHLYRGMVIEPTPESESENERGVTARQSTLPKASLFHLPLLSYQGLTWFLS